MKERLHRKKIMNINDIIKLVKQNNEKLKNLYYKELLSFLDLNIHPKSAIRICEAQTLYAIIVEKKYKNILEIGTGTGFSTCYLAKALLDQDISHHGAPLTTIDITDRKSEHSIILNLEKHNIKDYVNFIIGSSLDVLPALLNENKKYDLIFIDGSHDHETTKQDFNNSINLLNDGGCIVFHDVYKAPENNLGPRNVFDDVSSEQFYKILFNEELFDLFNYKEDILDAKRIYEKWQLTGFRYADPSANPKNLMGIVFKK